MTSAGDSGITTGAIVETRDGELLGEVKELHGPYFKVAAALHPDYWLQSSFGRVDKDSRIVMDFDRKDLDSYKVQDIDSDLQADAATRTDASLLGESGGGTDVTTAR